jgi:hypothetical protein
VQRFRWLFPLVMALSTGACSCLTGGAAMRLAPRAPAAPGAAISVPGGPARGPAPLASLTGVAGWQKGTAASGSFLDGGAGAAHDQGETGQGQALRDPDTAFCWACVVAGGGHFYTGETTRGALLLATAAGGLLGGALLSGGYDEGECDYDPETFECRDSGNTPLLIGAVVAAGSWIFGIVDARASAARVNARVGGNTGLGLETRPRLHMTGGEPAVALQVRLTW